MEEILDKIVEFDKYCKTCKYKDTKSFEDPCNECLDNPTNLHTKRPVCYKEDEKLKRQEEKKQEEQKIEE